MELNFKSLFKITILCLMNCEFVICANPNYFYHVNIADPNQANFQEKAETRLGEKAEGFYSVLEPDGRLRTVTYVSDEQGYRPTITYSYPGGLGSKVVTPGVVAPLSAGHLQYPLPAGGSTPLLQYAASYSSPVFTVKERRHFNKYGPHIPVLEQGEVVKAVAPASFQNFIAQPQPALQPVQNVAIANPQPHVLQAVQPVQNVVITQPQPQVLQAVQPLQNFVIEQPQPQVLQTVQPAENVVIPQPRPKVRKTVQRVRHFLITPPRPQVLKAIEPVQSFVIAQPQPPLGKALPPLRNFIIAQPQPLVVKAIAPAQEVLVSSQKVPQDGGYAYPVPDVKFEYPPPPPPQLTPEAPPKPVYPPPPPPETTPLPPPKPVYPPPPPPPKPAYPPPPPPTTTTEEPRTIPTMVPPSGGYAYPVPQQKLEYPEEKPQIAIPSIEAAPVIQAVPPKEDPILEEPIPIVDSAPQPIKAVAPVIPPPVQEIGVVQAVAPAPPQGFQHLQFGSKLPKIRRIKQKVVYQAPLLQQHFVYQTSPPQQQVVYEAAQPPPPQQVVYEAAPPQQQVVYEAAPPPQQVVYEAAPPPQQVLYEAAPPPQHVVYETPQPQQVVYDTPPPPPQPQPIVYELPKIQYTQTQAQVFHHQVHYPQLQVQPPLIATPQFEPVVQAVAPAPLPAPVVAHTPLIQHKYEDLVDPIQMRYATAPLSEYLPAAEPPTVQTVKAVAPAAVPPTVGLFNKANPLTFNYGYDNGVSRVSHSYYGSGW